MNRALLVFIQLLCLGCERGELLGRVGGPVGQGGTAGVGGSVMGGAAPDPIGPLVDLVARDTDPTFTADLTELYFMTTRAGSKDIWKSVRADRADEWGTPTAVVELSSGFQEENPRISADGLRLWFFTDRDRDRTLGTIWETTRAGRTDAWGPLARVPGLLVSAGSSDVSAGMNEDATLVVLSAAAPGAGGYDLFMFERASADVPFATSTPIVEVNSASDDFDPYLSPNGLALAFASNRRGSFDIFLARRISTEVPFEAPVPLELNSPDDQESAPNFSPDLAYLMYSSDPLGTQDIYEAELFP